MKRILPLCATLLRKSERRTGYTLVEILLVLAIVVLISAMALPAIQRQFARRQVQSAANTVGSKLSHARIGAMRSSHVYTFQYQTGSGSFRLAPGDQPSTSSQSDTEANCGQYDGGDGDPDSLSPEDGTLPDGIRFLADETPDPDEAGDAVAQNAAQSASGSDGWSDPIFFYPDGTTSNARFVVASERGGAIHIRLRGITGNVVQGQPGPLTQ